MEREAPVLVFMPATTIIGRALVSSSGEGVGDVHQVLVTNSVSQLAEDNPLCDGLLTAQGKVLFDFILWADGEDVLVDCERNAAGDLAKRLTLYRLRRPIQIGREEVLCVHWSLNGEGPRDPRLPELGRRGLAPASEIGRAHV